jgi:uncharacterized membrane-anchored protein
MKLKLFILVLALQCAWIGYTVATQERALATGKVILLETRRVDPRDLLRGDYLILTYKISDLPTNLFSPPVKKDLPAGTKVFVALAPDTNQFYEVTHASTNALTSSADEILLRGTVGWNQWSTNTIHIDYGIENYFVGEGAGNPTGKLTAQIVVPASGRASIKQVLVNGRTVGK